jgi:uncharacterized protein YktA (UPF0223 family)
MSRDNIIDWVTQVDMAFLKRTEPWNMFDKYEAFADLVRADEREACAKVCESYLSESPHSWGGTTTAAAIRARGNT